jgi:hypothetical protein
MPRPTLPIQRNFGGNLLFERVVAAIGFDSSLIRQTLRDLLARFGITPMGVEPAEVGMLLPEIERRLLLLVPHEKARPSLARLKRLLLCWDALQ